MVKITYVLCIAMFIGACNNIKNAYSDPRTISGINPVFNKYIDTYIYFKGSGLNYDIPIQFGPMPSSANVGVCTRYTSGDRQIMIDQSFWNRASEQEKYELIFHELGHCDLNRNHDNTLINYKPKSIMYPYVFSIYSSDENNYMLELFNS